MPRKRADSYQRRGTTFCYCGQRIGTPNHNRAQCLFWLRKDPDPSHGSPVNWMTPWDLFDEARDCHESIGLEIYMTFWGSRYRAKLDALLERSPDWHRTYVAIVHEDQRAVDLAAEWGRPVGTVYRWVHDAKAFIRRQLGSPEEWNQIEQPEMHETYDPSAAARTAETEELKRLNRLPEVAA